MIITTRPGVTGTGSDVAGRLILKLADIVYEQIVGPVVHLDEGEGQLVRGAVEILDAQDIPRHTQLAVIELDLNAHQLSEVELAPGPEVLETNTAKGEIGCVGNHLRRLISLDRHHHLGFVTGIFTSLDRRLCHQGLPFQVLVSGRGVPRL